MTDAGARTPPRPRLLVERFSGRFWAWLDREEFLVPKNVLDIVAGQTVTWMGLFYCPLLPLLHGVFIFLTFYIKKVRARAGRGRRAPGWARGAPSAGQFPRPASARPLSVPSLGLRLLGLCHLANDPHGPLLAPSTPS